MLAVGAHIINVNGINLKQKTYIQDNDFSDEWYILDANTKYANAMLCSEASSFPTDELEEYYNTYAHRRGDDYYNLDKQSYINLLNESNYICTIGHGHYENGQVEILIGNSTLVPSDINSLPSTHFANTKLVVLMCCESGIPLCQNFVDILRAKGVQVVVGFAGSVETETGMFWTKEFIKAMTQGCSVEQAIEIAEDNLRDRFPGTAYESVINMLLNGIYFGSTDTQTVLFK